MSVHLGLSFLVRLYRRFIDIVDRRVRQVEEEGEKSVSKVILVMLLLPHLD